MNTHKNKPVTRNVEYSRDNIVERAGYISNQKRVENIIMSGKQLAEYRKSVYTNEIETEEPQINRAAQKNYDFAAFHEDAKEFNRRIKEKFSQQKRSNEEKEKATNEKYKEYLKSKGIDHDTIMDMIRQGKPLEETTTQKGGDS